MISDKVVEEIMEIQMRPISVQHTAKLLRYMELHSTLQSASNTYSQIY